MSSFEFFRAPDADAVLAVLDGGWVTAGPRDPVPCGPAAVFDAVCPTEADPADLLDLLDELIVGDPQAELTSRTVWPTVEPPDCFAVPGHPWTTGPWAYELTQAVRDALAHTPVVALLALRPYDMPPPAPARAFLPELAGLARRAVVAGELLYYWMDDPIPVD